MRKTQTPFFVVTPSYNQAQFIGETIRSVQNQNWPGTYWVIDGKSSDNTVKVLKKFPMLRWVSEKDAGQTDAINKGLRKLRLRKTRPGIVAYINSDDYYLPEAFRKVAEAFQKNPHKKWLVGDCQIIDAAGKPIQPFISIYKSFLRRMFFPQLLYILNPIPQPAVFIRTDALLKVGNFNSELRYVMDYEYWLRLQKRFGPPLFLHEPLAAFRIHQLSKGGTQFERQFSEQFQVARRFCKNSILLFLHHMHNVLTVAIYHIIKEA